MNGLTLTERQLEVADNLKNFKDENRLSICNDLKLFDWKYVDTEFDAAKKLYQESANQTNSDLDQLPREFAVSRNELDSDLLIKYKDTGLKAITNNELCVVTLSGGQASRLGAKIPKGIYPLDLGFEETQKNCLLYIQAAQISRLQQLANGKITWLIMTSKSTDAEIKSAIPKIISLAGLNMDQIVFFTQAEIPCLSEDGHFLTGENGILTSPNGNGGFYEAISPLLPNLSSRGVKYFHVYCVDNIIARVGDPYFVGACVYHQADCAAKTVEKIMPEEKIGVICIDHEPVNDESYTYQYKNQKFNSMRVRVIEYSEISIEQAHLRDPKTDNKLYFRDGNIANHFFSIEFLEYVKKFPLPYHVANKKIKVFDPKLKEEVTVSGIKLERFIFDSFGYSKNFMVYEVNRDDEFSPLKNNDTAKTDCPLTCLMALQKLHKKWILNAGLDIESLRKQNPKMITKNGIIDPLFTYENEGIVLPKNNGIINNSADISNVGRMTA